MTGFPHLLPLAKLFSLLIPTGLIGVGALGIKYPAYDVFRENKKNTNKLEERKNQVSKILDEYKLASEDYTDKLISTIFKSESTGGLTEEHKNLGISLYLLSFKIDSSNKTLVSIYDLINGHNEEGILPYGDLGNFSELEKYREYKLGIGSYKYLDLGFKEFEVDNWLEKTIDKCEIQIKDRKSNKFSKEFNGLNKGERAKLVTYLFYKSSDICSSNKNIKLEDGKGISSSRNSR